MASATVITSYLKESAQEDQLSYLLGTQFKLCAGTVTFAGNYIAGGCSINLASRFEKLMGIVFEKQPGFEFVYDPETDKVKIFGAGIEAYTIPNLKGSENTNSETTDQAALPTNGAAIMSAKTIADGKITPGTFTNPDVTRNIAVCITNDSGEALDAFEGVTEFTITGTRDGVAQTEVIKISNAAATKSIANNKHRFKYGVLPFSTVTSLAIKNPPADGLKLSLGYGSIIGLPAPLATANEDDVLSVTINGVRIDLADVVDENYNSLNLGDRTDDDSVLVLFRSKHKTEIELAPGIDTGVISPIKFVAFGM